MNQTTEGILSRLSERDPRLGALIAAHPRFAVKPSPSLFEAIATSIMAQQLAWAAASTIIGRFKALYTTTSDVQGVKTSDVWAGFPTPANVIATDLERLRSVGLSRAKASYIQDLASKVLDGTIDIAGLPAMTDAAAIEHLIQVKGVGRWTAEMVLIFDLGRLDVLPVADLGVRKGFQRTYDLVDLPTPTEMEQIAEPWRPYRSIGTWYMWQAVDTKAKS